MDSDKALEYTNGHFSTNDWENYGALLERELTEEIPKEIIEYLKKPCPFTTEKLVHETHFLFFLPSTLDGIVLTINSMRRLLRNQTLLRFYSPPGGWFSEMDFANFSEPGSWKLLFAGPLPNSKSLTYKKQKRLFREGGYINPCARTAIAMIILKAKKCNQLLSVNEWGRTCESYNDGLRIRIGILDEGAICISSRWSGRGYCDTGIYAQKIFH